MITGVLIGVLIGVSDGEGMGVLTGVLGGKGVWNGVSNGVACCDGDIVGKFDLVGVDARYKNNTIARNICVSIENEDNVNVFFPVKTVNILV